MKVAYLFAKFPSLTETFAVREIAYLNLNGFKVYVLAAKPEVCTESRSDVQYRPRRMSLQAWSSLLYLVRRYPLGALRLIGCCARLCCVCRKEGIQLLSNVHAVGHFARILDREGIRHVHAYWLSWPACLAVGLSVATGRTLSIAAHARDIFVESGALKWKMSRADFVVACTRQGLNYLRSRLPLRYHRKVHLVHHGIDLREASDGLIQGGDQLGNLCGNNTIVAIGRLVPKKGFRHLLRAFDVLRKERDGVRLVVVGDGPEKTRLSGIIEELHMEEAVTLSGQQPHGVAMQLLKSAPFLVVPSVVAGDGDRDGIPNVILEAFACGVPVVASRLEGIREVVEHMRTGILVDPGDVDGLAMVMSMLLSNRSLRAALSRQAYRVLRRRFDARTSAERLARLFVKVSR